MIIADILFRLIQLIATLLFDYWLWVPLVGGLVYMITQNLRKSRWVSDSRYSLLLIEIPKDNEKQELSAEQMFASLHGILRSKQELLREGAIQEHLSFEIVSVENRIRFYVWTPHHLKNFVEGQIYAQYPTVNIQEITSDYAKQEMPDAKIYGAELMLNNNEVMPIRTFKNFDVDPLAGITAPLAKLDEQGEQAWIQVLARPIDDSWHQKGERFIQSVKQGKGDWGALSLPGYILKHFFAALWAPPEEKVASAPELSEQQKAQVTAVGEKIGKLGYEVKIRLIHVGPNREISRLRIQSLVGAFKQFNDVNGFSVSRYIEGQDALTRFKARLFMEKGDILNIEELASVYHLPHKNVETPSMVWATTKTAEPPSNLPSVGLEPSEQLSPIGTTNFRGHNTQFGLKRSDRGRHVYIIGQTGTGKSHLLKLITLSDVFYDQGFAIIDPHGDYATDILKFIPESRIKDVIYFNPTDTNFPIAFNPLELTDPALKGHISSELVGVLKRMFEATSWGPRLEYILRYTILALLDSPNTTMLGITRMLTEKDFRKRIVKQIQDPVVKNFWVTEFASWNEKFASEAVAPVLNKVGAFTANPLIRNIVGQPKSAIDIRRIMDEGKILIVNLSRGQVGEDNAAILGALMVTKIQLAAMSRANIDFADRRPFYLYVDEFQNFATDSFAVILSEARKYGLNLTIANQYVAQLAPEVRDAVFGNVGTMVLFRVGAEDATTLGKYVAPAFEPQDLITQHNYHFIASMSIDGEKVPPFTGKTLLIPEHPSDYTAQIVEHSRASYSTERSIVEAKIAKWSNFEANSDGAAQRSNASEQKPNTQSKPRKNTKVTSEVKTRSNNELAPEESISLRK